MRDPESLASFLALALSEQRAVLLMALQASDYTQALHLDLPVRGVPGASSVSLLVWPEPRERPTRLGLEVRTIDGERLRPPLALTVPLERLPRTRASPAPPSEAPRARTLLFGAARWEWVPPGLRREVRALRPNGEPIYAEVDTATSCYELVCPRCGRKRYAHPRTVHEIRYCWVCTRAARNDRKARAQRRKRGTAPRERRAAPAEVQRRRGRGESVSELAERFGVSIHTIYRRLRERV